MKQKISFSGCPFEAGQSKMGLQLSAIEARKYFPLMAERGFELIDHQDVNESIYQNKYKFFSLLDLKKPDMSHYKSSYEKTCSLLDGKIPLINWGGDHSIALSTVSAFTSHFKEGYVVWIDAHADLNLPSKSPTGHLHGMPLAFLLNLEDSAKAFDWMTNALNCRKLIYIGLRDLDPFEEETIAQNNIMTFTWNDIKNNGIEFITKQVADAIEGSDLHISFDIDSVDPLIAPSTGVPVKQGLIPEHLTYLCQHAFSKAQLRSVDVVEINPCLGNQYQVNRTYKIAYNFLSDLFNFQRPGDKNVNMGKRSQNNNTIEMEWNL